MLQLNHTESRLPLHANNWYLLNLSTRHYVNTLHSLSHLILRIIIWGGVSHIIPLWLTLWIGYSKIIYIPFLLFHHWNADVRIRVWQPFCNHESASMKTEASLLKMSKQKERERESLDPGNIHKELHQPWMARPWTSYYVRKISLYLILTELLFLVSHTFLINVPHFMNEEMKAQWVCIMQLKKHHTEFVPRCAQHQWIRF